MENTISHTLQTLNKLALIDSLADFSTIRLSPGKIGLQTAQKETNCVYLKYLNNEFMNHFLSIAPFPEINFISAKNDAEFFHLCCKLDGVNIEFTFPVSITQLTPEIAQ